jgi:hypothetical protein
MEPQLKIKPNLTYLNQPMGQQEEEKPESPTAPGTRNNHNVSPQDDSWRSTPGRNAQPASDRVDHVRPKSHGCQGTDSPPFHSFETPQDSQDTPTRGTTGSARRLIDFNDFPASDREPTPPTAGTARPTRARRAPLWHKDYEKDFESSSITAGRHGFRLGGMLEDDEGKVGGNKLEYEAYEERHWAVGQEAGKTIKVLLDLVRMLSQK